MFTRSISLPDLSRCPPTHAGLPQASAQSLRALPVVHVTNTSTSMLSSVTSSCSSIDADAEVARIFSHSANLMDRQPSQERPLNPSPPDSYHDSDSGAEC